MPILLTFIFILLVYWLFAAFVFVLHYLSLRISLTPLIITLGAYTAAMQFCSLGIMTWRIPTLDISLSIGSFILLPNLLIGILLIYIIHGSTPARNLLIGIILTSFILEIYQHLPNVQVFLLNQTGLSIPDSTTSIQLPIVSTITLVLDFTVLILSYQWLSNIRKRFPSKLAGCGALSITLGFDSVLYPSLLFWSQINLLDIISLNIIVKVLFSITISPVFSYYLKRIPKNFPFCAASTHRPLFDIFSSRAQQYENNLLKLNQLTTELIQLHDIKKIFSIVNQVEEDVFQIDANIVILEDDSTINGYFYLTHNLQLNNNDPFLEIFHNIKKDDFSHSGEVLVINDFSKYLTFPEFQREILHLGFISGLFLPIYRDATISGFHILLYKKHRSFTSPEIQLALTITNGFSIAIQNAHLHQSKQTERQFAEALIEATAILNSTLYIDQLLESILEQTIRVLPCRSANLMLVKENQAIIVRQIQKEKGKLKSLNYGPSIPISTLTLQQMIETNRPLLISDTQSDSLWQDLGTSDWIRSYAAAPLQIRDETIGFLGLNSDQPNFFTQETINRLQAFAFHAAAALHNARLYQHLQEHSLELEKRVKERTAELSLAKNRIEAILNAVPEAVFVLDDKDSLLDANHAGKLLIYEAQEARFDLFHPDLLRQLKQSYSSNEQNNLELNQRSYQAIASTFQSDKKKSPGLIIVYRDVTHFRELDDMKNQFVSDVSHELRTPLTNLNLYLELLTSENQISKRENYLEILRRETQRLTALIEDLLTISRIESGRTQIQIRAVDISSIVQDLITDRKQMASHKGLDLHLDIPTKLPFAMVDPRSMIQVLSNLLTNAMNYTLPGGSININVDNMIIDPISWIRISIQDTGVGIQPDELPYIYDRFYRGSSSKVTQALGTGLGLAISKEILERMDGKIQVESIPNRGSTFTVWIKAML